MTRRSTDSFLVFSRAFSDTPHEARGRFLREMMAHTAAGLVVLEGHEEAAEAVYRLADAIVEKSQ